MNKTKYQLCILGIFLSLVGNVYAKTKKEKQLKVLIVVTSHDELGSTGKKTGYYLPEVTHPFFKLVDQGIDVEIASPKGGKAPMDERSRDLNDSANQRFLENKDYVAKLENTMKLSEAKPQNYMAILFAGGHGTMWDFKEDPSIIKLGEAIYQQGGIVAAVCHGPSAILNLKNADGTFLVKGKRVAGFSNDEEEAAGLTKIMPFLLETELRTRGGLYEKTNLWQKKVVVSERLITGQNPASAEGVGVEIGLLIKKLNK